ncbi:MAG TPA: hypothetical protein VFQ73_12195 [Flavisolibacter sp.]|jgi:hypothetical protein|nr:hypothetical protein [Flavisolibacter sp.]
MKLSEFILLNEDEKKSTVLHRGVLIGKRSDYNCLVFLFQMGSYYVETFCNVENRAIEEFRVFDNVKPLTPYLEMIHIDDLLKGTQPN